MRRIVGLAVLTLILFAGSLFAQSEKEYTVLGIVVEGNRSGSAETIISQSSIRKGDKISLPSDVVRRAMGRIWSQNIFSDVDIEVSKISPQTDGTDAG